FRQPCPPTAARPTIPPDRSRSSGFLSHAGPPIVNPRAMPRVPSPVSVRPTPEETGEQREPLLPPAAVAPGPVNGSPRGRRIAFGWYGGKFSHLAWLLPLLPACHHYCQPFARSAALLLNRDPSPVETYNDFDGEVVHFFRVLRTRKEELIEAIGLPPFSREEFPLACQPPSDSLNDLERARRFFVRARQVRTGLAQKASLGRW